MTSCRLRQSRGFYLDAPAGSLADETAKQRNDAPGVLGEAVRVIGAYEDEVLAAQPMEGVVLRYGFVSRWLPAFARWVGAPAPPRVSVDEARKSAGEEAVYYHSALTGASNRLAKERLGLEPRRLLWRAA